MSAPLRFASRAACLLGTLVLAACNQTAATPPAPSAANAPPGVTPSSFHMPEASGCAGEVARFRAIIDNDLATGHTTAGVHRTMSTELDRAGAACAAGRDAEGIRLVAATRARHGYP